MPAASSITETLTADHRRCDRLLAGVDVSGRTVDWAQVAAETAAFCAATEQHFVFEEAVLFPPLEAVSPMASGPTEMMRQQHAQIRQLLADLQEAALAKDAADFAGISETLHFLIQQHNAKEEGILYPLADRALGAQGAALAARLGQD